MPSPSTSNLAALPDVDGLKRLMQSLAMLDAIMSDDWEYRMYSFNSKWSKGEQMGSMRTGSGDELFVLFNSAGCWLKGFDHEAPMSPYSNDPPSLWPGLFEGVPEAFSACLTEPAFMTEHTTFCLWRRNDDESWSMGAIELPENDDPDGSQRMLELLGGDPADYVAYAEEAYEVELDLDAVALVYDHQPLTKDIIKSMNPEMSKKALREDIAEIGYPA